jgi:F0F1-type ATP synthase membrane subunit c/vacuolar-type H+-ATPase subunit K
MVRRRRRFVSVSGEADRAEVLIRPALIILFGLLFAKLVCFGCGLASGRTGHALSVIDRMWFDSEVALNVWELPPFVALAVMDAAVRRVRTAALRWGMLTGAWVGLIAPLLYAHCYVWLGIFRDGLNGAVLLVYVPLPVIGLAGLVAGTAVGGVAGLMLRSACLRPERSRTYRTGRCT